MIKLDYQLSAASPERGSEVDLAYASEEDLHYELFLGDVHFQVLEVDLSTDWGWVPVLDFALGLVRVLESLAPGTSYAFEFTESEATIIFARSTNDRVTVSASYVPGTATVVLDQLLSCARAFLRHLLNDLQTTYPDLNKNPVFKLALRESRDH